MLALTLPTHTYILILNLNYHKYFIHSWQLYLGYWTLLFFFQVHFLFLNEFHYVPKCIDSFSKQQCYLLYNEWQDIAKMKKNLCYEGLK